MKIVELIVDAFNDLTGVDAVALVNKPAIEADFFAFEDIDLDDAIAFNLIKQAVLEHFVDKVPGESKDEYISRCIPAVMNEGYDQDQASAICYTDWDNFEINVSSLPNYVNETSGSKFSFAINEDQQMVVGPLMIPDKLIMRLTSEGEPYYVYFSKDTIKVIAEKVMKDNQMHNLNLEHNPEEKVEGYMVSTWVVEDALKDKQQVYGFNHPEGTWMGQYKIENKSVWEKVKNGDIKGFSVEGFFSDRFVQASSNI